MSGEEFLDRLIKIASGHERIIVIGQIDTGKSTLIKNMADHMDTYVLDADVGQNDIGPPSVVSLGERNEGRYRMIDGYFCGSTTPSRHFLQMIAGVSRLIPQCRNRPVLINTTGLATGEIGRALKTEKINAIKPDLIIGLETGNELKYLDAFAAAGAEVLKFRPHPQVTSRSRSERENLREGIFRAHFQDAVISSHSLDEIGIERSLLGNGVRGDIDTLSTLAGTPIVHVETTDGEALVVFSEMPGDLEKVATALDVNQIFYCNVADFNGTLVGLMGPKGNLLGLGVIDSVDFVQGIIHIFSPTARFSAIQFGSIKLDVARFTTAGSFSLQVYRHKH
jgi:polynucleotide 5'-hydroxyl-kinase GRC3/NOL9